MPEPNKQYKDLTDEELLGRLHAGETQIMEYLLDKYKFLVKKQARTMYLIGGENDDLIQEGMIGLYKAVKNYRPGEGAFYTFARLCVTRQMYTAVQASMRKKHEPLNGYVPLDEKPYISPEPDPEELLISQEDMERRYDQIHRRLSDQEKLVLELYLEGMSYSQIAAVTGKNEKAVDNAIQRLKKKLDKAEKSVDTKKRL